MLEQYKKVFSETLEIDADEAETAKMDALESWDSLRHMNLIVALEDEFDIEMEPEDVIEITSFHAGIEILKKYGVAL